MTQAHKLHYIDMSWGEGGQISSNFYDAIFERSLRCYPSNVNVLSFERCIKHTKITFLKVKLIHSRKMTLNLNLVIFPSQFEVLRRNSAKYL